MQVGSYLSYPASNYDYKLYCLMTLKKAEEAGLISNDQYENKQREFLKAIKFVVEEGAVDAGMLASIIFLAEILHCFFEKLQRKYFLHFLTFLTAAYSTQINYTPPPTKVTPTNYGEKYHSFEASQEYDEDGMSDYDEYDEMVASSNDGSTAKYRTFSEFMYP